MNRMEWPRPTGYPPDVMSTRAIPRGARRVRRGYRYLLGDSSREAARLRAQARLWDPTSRAMFDRLGIRRGWQVLEIGPGQGSLHVDLRRRVGGPVDAVERSAAFCRRLERLAVRDGLGQGHIWNADLMEVDLPRGEYDLVFGRWVLLFLPDQMAVIRKLARALKPGGLLAVQDYHRETFALIPLPPEWADFLAADQGFFASQGGDASIGSRLPELYRRSGLDVVEIQPTIKVGHPDSPVWKWLSSYFLGVMDRLADIPPFSRAGASSLRRRWLRAARQPTSVMIAPTVLDVVGRKPLRPSRAAGVSSASR